MRKQELICLVKSSCTGWLRTGILVLFVMAANAAFAAGPVNDFFTNATVIKGITGTTNGSNVGATTEKGEPVDAGVGGGKTIWYKWTATITGTELFNTEGSGFDTVMGVYTGTSVSNLTLVGQNDDVAFPSDLTSVVSFPVIAGTNYYISVDGHEGDSGSVILNWQATGSFSAGQLGFATPLTVGGVLPYPAVGGSPLYSVGSDDSIVGPFWNFMRDFGVNARVVRNSGNAGKIEVNYTVTSGFYTNIYITNTFGTNILISGADGTVTNVFYTNFFAYNQLQDILNGGLVRFTFLNGTNVIVSNTVGPFGSNSFTTVTNVGTNVYASGIAGCPPDSYVISSNSITFPPGFVTNSATPPVVFTIITNIFCINTVVTNIVPSATPGTDYIPSSGTLTMVDYQMGANIPITVLPFSEPGFGATNPPAVSVLNHYVVVTLTNAVLDPAEAGTALSPPVIAATNLIVQILNNQTTLVTPSSYNPQFTTNATANWLKSVFWVDEAPIGAPTTNIVTMVNGMTVTNTYKLARVSMSRGGFDPSVSLTVSFTADQITPPTGPVLELNSILFSPVIPLQPGSDYASVSNSVPTSRAPAHFILTSGTVSWGAYDTSIKDIDIPIIYDPEVQFNEDIKLEMWNVNGNPGIGQINNATLTILYNDQPAGAVDRAHNAQNSQDTVPPLNPAPGAGGSANTVYAAVVQPNTNTVIAGDFLSYNTIPRGRVARMNADGSLDTSFMAAPNTGANNTVSCLALQTNGAILIGGEFTSFNGTNRYHVARLNPDGSLDTTFNTGIGVNGTVWSMALQSDGRVLIGGTFSSVNSTNRSNIARLNTDGSLDTNFNPGIGPNGTVNAIALQADGRIIIGGQFTSVDGTNLASIARLTSSGALDATFKPGPGADGPVYALAEQQNGQVVVGGSFATIDLLSYNNIARLNSDGSADTSFNPGTGADGNVYALALDASGNVLMGGLFQSVNGTRRIGLARLYFNGELDTTFLDTAYNQFAGLITTVHNQAVQPRNFLFTIAPQSDGKIIIGGHFTQLGGGTDTNPSETAGDNAGIQDQGTFKRDIYSARLNVARVLGGSTPGPGNIGFTYGSYNTDKDAGLLYVDITRANGFLGAATVTCQPNPFHSGSGDAVPNVDYVQAVLSPTWALTGPANTWFSSDAQYGPNSRPLDSLGRFYQQRPGSYLTILNNTGTVGNVGLNLQLTQPTATLTLGGEPIPLGAALGNASAPLTIVDDSVPAGTLNFSAPAYYVNENSTNATITVLRTNGSTGPITVQYLTIPGTAQPGPTNDYLAVSGTLTFNSGETIKTFQVPIINNFVARLDRTLTLSLYNVTGGGLIGAGSNATLSIINDNISGGQLAFGITNYTTAQNSNSVTVNVTRRGGSLGTVSINFATSDGTAFNGPDYVATNGVLTWNSGDVSDHTFTVPLRNSGLVGSNVYFNLMLTNFMINGAPGMNFALFTNAIVTITNENFYGSPTFSIGNYFVNENAGVVVITVNRLGGSSQAISVNYATSDATARSFVDYTPASGTLTFTNGQVSQSFTVPINDTFAPQTNNLVYFNVNLSGQTPSGVVLGNPSTAQVTIVAETIENQPPGSPDTTYAADAGFNSDVYCLALQSDGSLLAGGDFTQANGIARNRIARLNISGQLDSKFSSGTDGANASVRAMAIQTDGEIVLGGLFTTMNGVNQGYISRLEYDGSLDSQFENNIGSGADNPVYAVAETFVGGVSNSNRRILIGGSFASVDGIPYRSIAQLNEDGTVDSTFNTAGANATVFAIAVYSTNDPVNAGKIVIGGDFTAVNGVPVNYLARLNPDGSLDSTFNIQGQGPDASVRAIAIQIDGNIVIGGLFANVDGVPLNHIARITPQGLIDSAFNVGLGANDSVSALAIQQDLKIVAGGSFTQASGVTRNRLTRFNPDGTVDAGINFGSGANSSVDAVVVQPNGELVAGGDFTQFNGQGAPHIVRLYGGTETGSGQVQFVSGNYAVLQTGTNVLIGVVRLGGTGYTGPGGANVTNYVVAATSNGSAIAGTDYIGVTNLLTFNPGETFQTLVVPVLADPTNFSSLTVNLTLSDPLSGDPSTFAQLGNQSTAVLTLIGANSTMSFASAAYAVAKNVGSGQAIITVTRNFSTAGTASVDVVTVPGGTATPLTDYIPVTNTVVFPPGQTNETTTIPIVNNGLPEGNVTVQLALANPTNTVLDPTLPTAATLTIIDNSQAPGNLEFSATTYTVPETTATAIIGIVRTNGSVGPVSVSYSASGGTAAAGIDYIPTSGILSYQDGQLSNYFTVTIKDNTNLASDVTVNLTLSSPTGGAQIFGPATVPLTIQNQNLDVSFAQSGYFVDEQIGSLTIGVTRLGNTNATAYVNYSTANGTALAGVNYNTTAGSLVFAPGQTFQTFMVPILYDPQVTGNLVFFVNLFATNGSGVQLVSPSTATVTVLDDNFGFALVTNAYSIFKANTNIIIPVFRSGSTAGSATVAFSAITGTAVANVEYVPTNGLLTFTSGQASNSFSIGILNDNRIDGDQTVNIALSAPSSGGQILSPSNAVLTILDDSSGFSFSSQSYSVNENGVSALITVVRSGYTNSLASVSYSTSDGSAHAGSQYQAAAGTLTFTNGQTAATFSVPIIDNNVTGGSETVNLLLSGASANGSLINPSAATLTIVNNDGSLIVPAGSAVLSPTNGVIYPNTNVTILLSLLNTAGSTATNVTATLLATNGVTPTGTTTQNYGNMAVNGPSVFRQFTFNTAGSNGAVISAVLALHYNNTNSTVSFTYTLGSANSIYTNGALITINDLAAASPYPSTINIASAQGVVNKVTCTVSNLGHGYSSDISMLLVGPSGQKVLLMEQTGGSHVVTNLDLTFDSTVTNALTSSAPASGTYQPSPLLTSITFHTSSNNVTPPPGPYTNNTMNTFIGANPNGVWSLYVDDTKYLDSGTINNGWSLTLNTLNVVLPNEDLVVGITGSPSSVVLNSNVTYVISVTNAGPSSATGVTVTNILPAGLAVVSVSPSSGTYTTNNGTIVCNLGNLTTNGTASITVVAAATALGTVTNTVSVSANEIEDNPLNNVASVATTIAQPSADLALSAILFPNPVVMGNNVTYQITVSNLGPATATGVIVTNVLPAGFAVISNNAPGGASTNGGVVTFSLGNLGNGSSTTLTLVAKESVVGTNLITFGAGSGVLDPLKGNNVNTVKSIVLPLSLAIKRTGSSLTFSWPASGTLSFSLESTTNLTPPIFWTTNSTLPVLANGTNTVVLPVSGGSSMFFRLISN